MKFDVEQEVIATNNEIRCRIGSNCCVPINFGVKMFIQLFR